jgi:hypothetical protein
MNKKLMIIFMKSTLMVSSFKIFRRVAFGTSLHCSYHTPVMKDECCKYLQVKKDVFYVDCTLGGGGHTRAILELGGRVIAIDQVSLIISMHLTSLFNLLFLRILMQSIMLRIFTNLLLIAKG